MIDSLPCSFSAVVKRVACDLGDRGGRLAGEGAAIRGRGDDGDE